MARGRWRPADLPPGAIRARMLALLALPALASAQAPECAAPQLCTPQEFVTRLLQVADEPRPARVPEAFGRAFGSALGPYTRVLVSQPIEGAQKNMPARFVRLGDESHPLRFSAQPVCVTFGALARGLVRDGWEGGVVTVPGPQGELARYLKGHTQLTAQPAAMNAAGAGDCIQSILITFRH